MGVGVASPFCFLYKFLEILFVGFSSNEQKWFDSFFLNPPSGNDLTYFTTFHFKNRGKNDDIHGRNELQTDEVRVKKCLTIFTTVKLASNSYFQL